MGDGVRNVVQHHGFPGLGGRNDESTLTGADGGNQVDDPGGHVLGGAVADFKRKPLVRMQRREVLEQHLVLGVFWRFEIDFADFQQGEVAL